MANDRQGMRAFCVEVLSLDPVAKMAWPEWHLWLVNDLYVTGVRVSESRALQQSLILYAVFLTQYRYTHTHIYILFFRICIDR